MAMVKKSIALTDQQDNWIKRQVEGGHYGNASEVVRELIRERQLREQETSQIMTAIRSKLVEAEEGAFSGQSPAEILKDIKGGLGRGTIQDKS